VFPNGQMLDLHSPLRGRFNASNLLAAAGIGLALKLEPEVIVRGLSKMVGAPGRFEAVHAGQPFSVYVDYAHTPDAVERVLENVRAITPGRVLATLGCGGDRDPGKRPIMGALLGRLADYSIITNDNPRTEDPVKIAEAVEAGIQSAVGPDRYMVCLDRRAAIRKLIEMAQAGDSVVIAGKGHENYQIIGTTKSHFDDRETAAEICRELWG
ncbi:TPA: UDP-N-acetylmuramoyl-L-alanyl-D-glutamate--2,6-diaminopimelate ligase, partial [Candidatus Sumerlaeota bacterium]|nr:UDP-N-acetylmuramoyl-L-alanyl-D-glutamate--2,6-diaminopimelate ligase [Candidatus Sumerlaeota bacterium]